MNESALPESRTNTSARVLSQAQKQTLNAASLFDGRKSRADVLEWPLRQRSTAATSLHLVRNELSSWSRSTAKRYFDCASVLVALPFLVPVLLAVALAVRVTSRGPVLFLQRRTGRHGRLFTIVKFRTIRRDAANHAVTTADNQPFTPIGPFLRRWKLDELP